MPVPSDNSLSVLYVGTLPPHRGGSTVSCSQLMVGLARLGHVVRAIGPITAEALEAGDHFALAVPELQVWRYTVPYFYVGPTTPPPDDYRRAEGEQIAQLFTRLVAASRPDVVVAGRESFAWYVPRLAAMHGLPCVVLARGTTSAAILNGTYGHRASRHLLAEFRKADLIVAPARHLGRELQRLGLADVRVIPNGLDLKRFRPRRPDRDLSRRLGLGDDAVVVAHVSNLKPIKRPLDIVESAKRAVRAGARLAYLVVGDGPCREEMAAACASAGLTESFTFVGWIKNGRVPDYLSLADIVVMASEWEAQARVYLETQACGRTLLASDVAGASEVVVDGETGFLYRVGDVDELASKTLTLARRPELRARIGARARHAVCTRPISSAVAAYDALLREAVCTRGNVPTLRGDRRAAAT